MLVVWCGAIEDRKICDSTWRNVNTVHSPHNQDPIYQGVVKQQPGSIDLSLCQLQHINCNILFQTFEKITPVLIIVIYAS
jgi:hypothetical protein